MKYEVAFAFEGLESSGLAVKYCFLHLFSDSITPLCSLSLTLIQKKSSLSLTSFMDFIDCSTFFIFVLHHQHTSHVLGVVFFYI